MLSQKRIVPILIGLLLMISLTACGGFPSSVTMVGVHATATTSTGTTTTYGTATVTSTTTTTGTATAKTTGTVPNIVVKTGKVYVGDAKVMVLMNSRNMPLYYSLRDTKTASNCTGKCASIWPPLLYSGGGTVPTDGSITGTLSVVSTIHGKQVAYNGHLLYLYKPDVRAPTSANGEGVNRVWFVATLALEKKS
jgi:predicted lipoprotein with Yx(FWY)xxD motif